MVTEAPVHREWTTVRVSVSPDSSVFATAHQLKSGVAGPHVLVLGGVHGDEVGGILAAGQVVSTNWDLQRGQLTVVPITHEVAYEANSRVSPLDGMNLARAFPGALGGTPTEELAWLVTHELILHADLLIDLHTSNVGCDMPLFVGCVDDGSAHATAAVELARGFGFPVLWTHPTLGPGRTLSVAHEQGIPSLYVESPQGGILNDRFLAQYVDGVRSALETLRMIPSAAARPGPVHWLHGNGDTDTFRAASYDGFFIGHADLMSNVERGQNVGRIVDSLGSTVEEILSPTDGIITTLQRMAVVKRGQPIVGITRHRPPRLGLASDDFYI